MIFWIWLDKLLEPCDDLVFIELGSLQTKLREQKTIISCDDLRNILVIDKWGIHNWTLPMFWLPLCHEVWGRSLYPYTWTLSARRVDDAFMRVKLKHISYIPDQQRCFQCPRKGVHLQTISGLFSSGLAFEVQHLGPIIIFGDDLILNMLQL